MIGEIFTPIKGYDSLNNRGDNKLPRDKFLINNIGNNQKKISSVNDWTSYCRNENKSRGMMQHPKILPGQGALPPEPHLVPALSGAAMAIQAGAQLLTYNIDIRASSLNIKTGQASGSSVIQSSLSSAATYAQNIMTHIDGTFSYLVNRMAFWDSIEASPAPILMVLSLQPKGSGTLSAVELDKIAMMKNKAVEINNTTAPPGVVKDRRRYVETVFQFKNEYPELTSSASAYLRMAIREKYALEIDPDKTYFKRFNYASTSSETFTGWEHTTPPVESKSLTERLLENFGAEDQINSDALSGNSGIYTDGAGVDKYGKDNEVRLLPKDFLNLVFESNFSYKILKRLENFWRKNRVSFRTISKGIFITLLGQHSTQLSENGLKLVIRTVLGDISSLPDMTINELEREVRSQYSGKISTFNIYDYLATDIYLIHGNNGEIVLYHPSGAESFIEFENTEGLKNWVLLQAKDPIKCEKLASHFSLSDRQEGNYYSGIDSILRELAKGQGETKYINHHQKILKDDLFTNMMHASESRTVSDVHTLTTTNGEVFRGKVLMNLRAAANVAGVVTVVLPGIGSLSLMGIGIIQTGLGINNLVYGDTEKQRMSGIKDIIDGGVNTLFGAMGTNVKTPSEEFSAGESEIDENAIHEADEIHQPGSSRPNTSPQRGTFLNRLFGETIVHKRGLSAITADNPIRGRVITITLHEMEIALKDAKAALATPKGGEIAARYLGYERGAQLADADILEINQNIEALEGAHDWLVNTDKSIKTVSIFGPRGKIVTAYYNPKKHVITLTDRFFSLGTNSQLHVLLHEGMHASVREGAKAVPDYFYLRSWGAAKETILNAQRDEQLHISRGSIYLGYFTGTDGHLLKKEFMKKMGTDNLMVAGIRFQDDAALRRAMLLKNPDTQAIMIMELAGLLPDTTNADGSMRLPWDRNNNPHSGRHDDHPGAKAFLVNDGG